MLRHGRVDEYPTISSCIDAAWPTCSNTQPGTVAAEGFGGSSIAAASIMNIKCFKDMRHSPMGLQRYTIFLNSQLIRGANFHFSN